MQDFIKEVPSDSAISSVFIEKETVNIEFKLYTEDSITIRFSNVEAIQLLPQWKHQDIEGIKIVSNSVLLADSKKQLVEDEVKTDGLKSFQVTGISGNMVAEIIGHDYQII